MKNKPLLQFEQALPEDAPQLTETAFSSKRKWNYTDQQMALWTIDLTITKSYIRDHRVFKIVDHNNYIGFFALVIKGNYIELDHFWLLPENTEKGYGRMTFEFILQICQRLDYKILKVFSEPYANGFYKKMGGKIVQSKESKIKERFLDVYEFEVF